MIFKLKLFFFSFFPGRNPSPDPFYLGGLSDNLPASTGAIKKTPQSFLGENSALVNLDNLVSTSMIKPTAAAAAPAPAGKILIYYLFLFSSKQKFYLTCRVSNLFIFFLLISKFHIFLRDTAFQWK